jgi:hypothetical protein
LSLIVGIRWVAARHHRAAIEQIPLAAIGVADVDGIGLTHAWRQDLAVGEDPAVRGIGSLPRKCLPQLFAPGQLETEGGRLAAERVQHQQVLFLPRHQSDRIARRHEAGGARHHRARGRIAVE